MIGNPNLASDLLKLAEGALSRPFIAYKGGEYWMDEETVLWVANYGDASQLAIIDIVPLTSGRVLQIRTKQIKRF